MKSIRYIFVAAMAMMALNASALSDYRLGLCDNSQTLSDKSITLGGKCDLLSAAIYLSGEELAKVAGGEFTGVNVGLNNTFNVSSITGWIRTELDGEDLVSSTMTKESSPAFTKGWNALKFDTPLKIEADKGYYIGYTMQHAKGLGVAYMAIQTGATAPGGCWTNADGRTWTDNEQMGILFLEALIQSENIPVRDLRIIDAAFDHKVYPLGSQIGLDIKLQNMGLDAVTGFDLTLSCKEAGISITRDIECDIPYNERYTTSQKNVLPDMDVNKSYTFTVSIDKVNGEADQFDSDNVRDLAPLPVIEQMFERTIVYEEFTNEFCSNCPNAAKNLKFMLDALTEEESEHTAVVCHHGGNAFDKFTQPCDQHYYCFYPQNRPFAPAFMLDREPQGNGAPIFELTNYVNLLERARKRLAEPSYYSIEVTGNWQKEASKVVLKISGIANRQVCSDPRITVYLTEDGVKPYSQSGTSDPDYKHDHVIRAFNATWGESPEWSDERNYSYTCELTYPAGCKPDNMEIVAMISNYDEGNVGNRMIQNASKVALTKLGSVGLHTLKVNGVSVRTEGNDIVAAGDYDAMEVFDLSGNAVPATGLASGIYLVRVSSGAGTETAKVAIP